MHVFLLMFPGVPLYGGNVRLSSRLLDRQQTQTGASPRGQEEEDVVHCAADRDTDSGSLYVERWPLSLRSC